MEKYQTISSEKRNFFELMIAHQWLTRVMIDDQPHTVIIKDIFTKADEEFILFEDKDNNQKTLRADQIDVPTFTMD